MTNNFSFLFQLLDVRFLTRYYKYEQILLNQNGQNAPRKYLLEFIFQKIKTFVP